MADTNLVALPTGKHPFQLDCTPWLKGPYEVIRMTWESVPAFFARLDMPGCYGVSRFKKGNSGLITFNARAPKKEGFPYDESERVYAGCFNVAGEALVTPVRDIIRNGCFFMFFLVSHGTLFFLPPPRSPPSSVIQGSVKSEKSEGSSSGKSIVEERDINLDAVNLEESARTELGEGSSCGKSIDLADPDDMLEQISLDAITLDAQATGTSESVKVLAQVSAQGSGKSEQKEGSSEKSIDKPQGSAKSGSGESASNESAEDSGKPRSSKSSSNEDDEAWMLAWIKTNVLQIHGPELPKEESTPVENSSEQPRHEAPEIGIGSVEECEVHSPQCECQRCDSSGVCLKTWSTTEDVIAYVNQLKIQGPDGVCEKRVVQEDGRYSLYVRADLPGLEPCLCTATVKDRCILVYGKLPPKEVKKKHRTIGARSYLFFVQLRCSCCKFDNLCQHHADGVLRLFCNIRGPEPSPSAD